MGGCFPREAPPDFNGPVDFSHFHILRAVGKGAFGKVCIVKKKDTKQMYAMKYMNKIQIITKHAVENVFREQELLSALEHPFLVNLWFTFQDAEDIFMVMDLMLGGDLSYHLTREGRFAVPRVVLYVAEMALVLEYLRERQIIHRDVKPANMLLDLQGHVHLTDFNVACVVKPGAPVTSVTGTKPYMAPEVIHPGSKGYSYAVDWWSLGVSAYEMLRGQRPFHIDKGMSNDEIYAVLKHTHPTASAKWDGNVCDLLQRLLHPDERKRLQSVKRVKELQSFVDLNWADVEKGEATPPFIPPQNRINCDPTHELEEMIVEPNPLHKKATRLSKRQPHNEDEKIQSALDRINKDFITYNRTKERKNRTSTADVVVEYESKGERVSFVETAVPNVPSQVQNSTDHTHQDINDKEGVGSFAVIEVTAEVHEELPHPQAQATSCIAHKEHAQNIEGVESCTLMETIVDVHKELSQPQTQATPNGKEGAGSCAAEEELPQPQAQTTPTSDRNSDCNKPKSVLLINGAVIEGSAPHMKETEKALVPEQVVVVLGGDMDNGKGDPCVLEEVKGYVPKQNGLLENLTTSDNLHSNQMQATLILPDKQSSPQDTTLFSEVAGDINTRAVADSNEASTPAYRGTEDQLFVGNVCVNHTNQSVPQAPCDLNTSVGCKDQIDSISRMMPLVNTIV